MIWPTTKNIPRIHVHGKWDNNNKHNGVQIQATIERKMRNCYINTKHIRITISKIKYEHKHNNERLKPRTKMALKWAMMTIAHPIDIFSAMKDHKYP